MTKESVMIWGWFLINMVLAFFLLALLYYAFRFFKKNSQ